MELHDLHKEKSAVEAKLHILELQEKLKNINLEIDINRNILKNNCQHTNYSRSETYISGSYYDKSYVEVMYICKLCGKVLNKYRDNSFTGSYD